MQFNHITLWAGISNDYPTLQWKRDALIFNKQHLGRLPGDMPRSVVFESWIDWCLADHKDFIFHG